VIDQRVTRDFLEQRLDRSPRRSRSVRKLCKHNSKVATELTQRWLLYKKATIFTVSERNAVRALRPPSATSFVW
jgi:hypothetical protein